MGLILIILNIIAALIALIGTIYLIRITLKTEGNLKTAMWFISSGFIVIVIEHFIIAWLRRSSTPLESNLWMIPFPFYLVAIILILIGGNKLNKLFSKMSSKK
jgi:hypothetical protein